MGRFDDKRVLITGGSTGIGLATAKRFLAEGARVAVCGRSEESLAAAKASLPDLLTIRADVSKVGDVAAMAAQVAEAFGGVDILFANAGVARMRPLAEFDEATFDEMMDINVKGLFFTVQSIVPLMGEGGVIMLTGSVAPKKGQPGTSVYAASKGAVRALAKVFAGELVDRGLRVVTLSPGPVKTPIFDKMGLSADEARATMERLASTIPLGRMGTVEEVAEAALFLASPEAGFIHGAELMIDGGKSEV